MKKFYILLFTILTLGIFLIPSTFAKSYDIDYYNSINYFDHIEYVEETRDFYIYSKPLSSSIIELDNDNSGYLHFSIQAFKPDGTISQAFSGNASQQLSIYFKDVLGFYSTSDLILTTGYYYYSTHNVTNSNTYHSYNNIYNCVWRFTYSQSFDSKYQELKTCNFNIMGVIDTRRSSNVPVANKYIPNTNNDILGYTDRGVFQYSSMDLYMEYTSSKEDISDYFGYNVFTFKDPLLTRVSSNNSQNTYQYHLIFNLNRKIGDFVNLKFSYLELEFISINGVKYDYATARSNYNFIYPNIVLYDNNSTLFTSGFDALTSEYKDFVIDFIQFRICDYTFTQSQYYNSNLGVFGYLESTYISVFDYNVLDYYNRGYQDGNKQGYDYGYEVGKQDGINSNETGFDNLMFAIADVPINIISSMLNFEILGFNLLAFFMGIITLLLFVKIMNKFKQ